MFVGELGGYLDGSALRRRYERTLGRAGLRFHDLRHTFGTRMLAKADIVRVQEWMGHAGIQTTRHYLHFRPQHEDAGLVAEAFAVEARPQASLAPRLLRWRGRCQATGRSGGLGYRGRAGVEHL